MYLHKLKESIVSHCELIGLTIAVTVSFLPAIAYVIGKVTNLYAFNLALNRYEIALLVCAVVVTNFCKEHIKQRKILSDPWLVQYVDDPNTRHLKKTPMWSLTYDNKFGFAVVILALLESLLTAVVFGRIVLAMVQH